MRLIARARRGAPAVALLLAACTTAEAAPALPPPYEAHPAVAIVDRLADTGMPRLPDLAGLTGAEAVAALNDLGLHTQVVAYDEGPVSAQYPEPGAPPPADRRVVVWTGAPPQPPPPPPDPPPAASPSEEHADGAADQVEAVEEPAAEPPPAAASDTATPAPRERREPPPTRTSPRRMAASESGAVLDGLASWYGPGFAGRTTACGQPFDPGALTLATRELRCGTRVEVTGPSGRSVEAVVTDWGPAEWTGRRFDLSQATFAAIHSLGAGVVQVTVEAKP